MISSIQHSAWYIEDTPQTRLGQWSFLVFPFLTRYFLVADLPVFSHEKSVWDRGFLLEPKIGTFITVHLAKKDKKKTQLWFFFLEATFEDERLTYASWYKVVVFSNDFASTFPIKQMNCVHGILTSWLLFDTKMKWMYRRMETVCILNWIKAHLYLPLTLLFSQY